MDHLHSGVINDYALFVVGGAAVVLIVVFLFVK